MEQKERVQLGDSLYYTECSLKGVQQEIKAVHTDQQKSSIQGVSLKVRKLLVYSFFRTPFIVMTHFKTRGLYNQTTFVANINMFG